jgi:hypothetical protein
MRTQSVFLLFGLIVQGLLPSIAFAQTKPSEQRFENRDIQLLWPVSCSSQSGLERSWSTNRSTGYQEIIGVDAVWGSIRKASVIDGERVEIKGHVGGSVCELLSDVPKKEYIWRTESIKDKDGITVYINVRQKTSFSRLSRYFKVNYLDDYRFELTVSVDEFFTPEDAQKIRAGEVLKNRQFFLLFKLNVERDNNTPAFYQYTYDVLEPKGRNSEMKINFRE